ncbi:hypothetical protein RND81_12G207400 [Saponaria officinalis]|uniref:Uncharacterized protein n=1 Tax=Saponaria officinalis TaxID=3572 RepID=A0AAW1HD79_SAPOF
MSRIWWGHDDEKRHIYWVAWNKLCRSKRDGGLDFRHLEAFNIAMLAKQLWRLNTFPDNLTSRLMKARYFPNSNPLEEKLGHHPSFVWQSLLEAQWVLQKGCRWLIRNGQRVRFWTDNWTLTAPTFRVWSPCQGDREAKVSGWIDGNSWNVAMLKQSVFESKAEEISKIPICHSSGDDVLVWHYCKGGEYTVKSGYAFIR